MADRTLSDIAEKMRDLDFCMLSTRTESGAIASRPMSNNRDVDYDGDSWFFTCDDTHMVAEIGADPRVGLSYQGKSGMLGMRPFFRFENLLPGGTGRTSAEAPAEPIIFLAVEDFV